MGSMPRSITLHGGERKRTSRSGSGRLDDGVSSRSYGVLGRHLVFMSPIFQSTIFAMVVLSLTVGCEKPPMTANGVVNIFGGVGRGPGAFSYPRAIAADQDGTVLVVDKAGRVQRFDERGVYLREWRMPETEQGKPVGLAVHPDGRTFVADTHYHRVLVFDREGNIVGSFGRQGSGEGELHLPTDVVFDSEGFIYVSEYNGNDRITKWTSELQFVAVIGADPIDGKRLRRPAAMVIDDDQTLWVADACNHRLVRFSLNGQVLATVGHYGRKPGELRYPYDIDLAPDGSLMVCEYGGDRLQWFSTDGRSLRVWGSSGREPGKLSAPWGAAYGRNGQVYIVDSLNSRIQVVRL